MKKDKIDEFSTLLIMKEKKEKDLLSLLNQVKETKKDLARLNTLLDECVYGHTPVHLTDIEKIVYYFNERLKVPLKEIAKGLGYSPKYIENTKNKLNKKLYRRPKK